MTVPAYCADASKRLWLTLAVDGKPTFGRQCSSQRIDDTDAGAGG